MGSPKDYPNWSIDWSDEFEGDNCPYCGNHFMDCECGFETIKTTNDDES